MTARLYAHRDIVALRYFYTRHVHAMTTEGLHDKSDIAAELAWRDAEIERLTNSIKNCGYGPCPTLEHLAFGELP